jgi:hypothetical protein
MAQTKKKLRRDSYQIGSSTMNATYKPLYPLSFSLVLNLMLLALIQYGPPRIRVTIVKNNYCSKYANVKYMHVGNRMLKYLNI